MSTHPMTRLTHWFVGHLGRNRREWITAYIAMFGFWDASFGLWNLAILATAIAGARLSKHKLAGRAARASFDWCLDTLDAMKRRRLIKRGPGAMVERFPVSSAQYGQHLLEHLIVRDQDGRHLYELRIIASAKHNAKGLQKPGVLQVGVLIINHVMVEKSNSDLAYLTIDADYRIRFKISSVDRQAYKVGDEYITIDLINPDTRKTFYTVRLPRNAGQSGEPEHVSLIKAAIKKITEQKLRAAARKILTAAGSGEGDLKALRRNFARLLHPDLSKSTSAAKALASINAALDTADKQFA